MEMRRILVTRDVGIWSVGEGGEGGRRSYSNKKNAVFNGVVSLFLVMIAVDECFLHCHWFGKVSVIAHVLSKT